MKPKCLLFLAVALSLVRAAAAEHTFSTGTNDFLLDGRRFQIRCGEIHAARVPREYWRHRLQMARAMGLNTVCAYLFWNMHEPRSGEFDWSGQADVAEFCRIAQQEGLWVILRPGPYSCAEWEMGGLPWWLLKHDDIRLRSRDPRFLDAARRYLTEVGRVLGPLQITQGGPILMVQVENEYGFYGKDAEYMGELRRMLLDAGFDVPLFACNPKGHLKDGWRADLFPVVNFGSDPAGAFKALREILPQGPLMCGEFYPGWFDTWGAPHHTGKTEQYLRDLEYMLKAGASFSIYMAHGGTTFGVWTGADRPFKPDTSSYDYDAPISEAGWTTEKFFQTRDLFAKYLLPGETIPEVPAKNRVIHFDPVAAAEWSPATALMLPERKDSEPRNMEQWDQGFGCVYHGVAVPAGPEATLEAREVRDFGYVYLEGRRIGVMDRRARNFNVRLPERSTPQQLLIVVEAMGRVNFGPEVHDRKGLYGPVRLVSATATNTFDDWRVVPMPVADNLPEGLAFNKTATAQDHPLFNPQSPMLWRAKVRIETPGDTFLDMRSWGKGYAWVNGRNLGRFWNIGPQQTMYVPGPWLKSGENEIVILDLIGPEMPVVTGLDAPILDQLRPEVDFARTAKRRPARSIDADTPVLAGTFPPGGEMVEVKFAAPVKGRFFAIESLNAHDGKPFAAIAEIALLGAEFDPMSAANWTIAGVDSEETEREDGSAGNAIDGQTANFWHSQWGSASPDHPHSLVIDLGRTESIGGFRYTPRQGGPNLPGRIKDYRVFIGETLKPAEN